MATWADEGLNLRLREAATSAHVMKQEERMFEKLFLQGSLGTLDSVWGPELDL